MSEWTLEQRKILNKAIIIAYDNNLDSLGDVLGKIGTVSSDEAVLSEMECIIDQGGSVRQEYNSSGGFSKVMVNIGKNSSFEVFKISSINREDSWKNNKYLFNIVINKDSNNSLFLANTTINFSRKSERDSEYDRIFRDLQKYSNVEFV